MGALQSKFGCGEDYVTCDNCREAIRNYDPIQDLILTLERLKKAEEEIAELKDGLKRVEEKLAKLQTPATYSIYCQNLVRSLNDNCEHKATWKIEDFWMENGGLLFKMASGCSIFNINIYLWDPCNSCASQIRRFKMDI
jgi:hypothetical protein